MAFLKRGRNIAGGMSIYVKQKKIFAAVDGWRRDGSF
jgi:hypothetical protein